MPTEFIRFRYIYGSDGDSWCYATAGIFVLLIFIIILIYRLRRNAYPIESNRKKDMSEEERRIRFPYGENFTYLFAVPCILGICFLWSCIAIHNLTRSTVVTISEDNATKITYALFSGGRPDGTRWPGEYVVNEAEDPLTIWKAGDKKSDTKISVIGNVPAKGLLKVKELPSMYLDSHDTNVTVKQGVVIISPMGYTDSIHLMSHSELRVRSSEDGIKVDAKPMVKILNQAQYEEQQLIRERKRQRFDSLMQIRDIDIKREKKNTVDSTDSAFCHTLIKLMTE